MKKNSLLKVILIVLVSLFLFCGLFNILGYFVPALEGKFAFMPIIDMFINFVQSFSYFSDVLVYILILGAFYSVLNAIPAYKKLIDNIVSKVKSKNNLFVYSCIIIFGLLAFVIGDTRILLIFAPFVASIILGLGYDKLVAISSTIAAMLVGTMSSLFRTFRDPNNYYGYSSTTFEKLFNLNLYENYIPKIILFVLGMALLIFFVDRYIKNIKSKKIKYELNESDEVEVSIVEENYTNIKTWPIITVFAILFVILFVGYFPWKALFDITFFEKLNKNLMEFKINDFPLFSNVFTRSLIPFGDWSSANTEYIFIILGMIFTIILFKFIYKIKFSDIIGNFVNGAKRMIPALFLIALSSSIIVFTINTGFVSSIITIFKDTIGINIGTSIMSAGIGSLLHNNMYYNVIASLMPIMQAASDESMYPIYALSFQSIATIIELIAPTSVILIFAISYLDIPYASWVKYIWRFILMLFLIIILVLLVMALI